MKRLLVIPLFLAVVGCQPQSKYPSKLQARQACDDWVEQGKSGDGEYRGCNEEMETNQILGVTWTDDEPRDKVARHFRY